MLSIVGSVICLGAGCSMLNKSGSRTASASAASSDDTATPAAATASASIQIAYAKADDTLQSVVVSQFTGASILRTRVEGQGESAVVRFDGGVPVWKFHANRSLLHPLSEIRKGPYQVASVEYGKLPLGFVQDIPAIGPPAPLDLSGYYVFTIERGSGAASYQVVKVNPDLSLQAYDAEPRAGTSYKLCCNVNPDFAAPTPEDIDQPAVSTPP